jgi:hypothetical protein
LTIRAGADSDDVRLMKKAIRMAYFNTFSAEENPTLFWAVKVQIPYMGAGYW